MKKGDDVTDLKIEFRKWRRQKQSRSETIPEELLAKAKAAATKHGVARVAKALTVERKRINAYVGKAGAPVVPVKAPSFSRIQVAFPRGPQSSQPLMEAETPAGVKLRIFAITPETVSVLSSFCRVGGAS